MYLDMCLDIITSFDKFQIRHISRPENYKANMLSQQTSDFDVSGRNFYIKEKSMQKNQGGSGLPELVRPVPETSQASFSGSLARSIPRAG